MKKLTLESAKERLRETNNCLSFYMKEKKALQSFIEEEANRVQSIASPRSKAYELLNDTEFIKTHGRKRTQEEVARIMGYSVKQVYRFLKEKD